MYSKIFSKIVTSSVWLEPTPTRMVWITLLALKDQDGFVQMSTVANLAHTARVTMEEAQAAVTTLENPEEGKDSCEFQGRRIERIGDGWMILKAKEYDSLVTREVQRERVRERVKKHRAKQAGNGSLLPVTQSDVDVDVDSEVTPDSKTQMVPSEPMSGAERVFRHWQQAHGHPQARLDEKRRRVILKALKSYDEQTLMESITGYKHSPHHMGQNDSGTVYDSLELFLRDAAHIDAGVKFFRSPPTGPESEFDQFQRLNGAKDGHIGLLERSLKR